MPFFSTLFGSKVSKSSAIKILTAEEFKSKIENRNVQLVDVRTPAEFKSGHLKGAKNIDFFSGKFKMSFNKFKKQEAVYVYCRSGSRSRQAAKRLEALGFNEIYDLKGGILKYR